MHAPVVFLNYAYSGNTLRFGLGDELSARLLYLPGDLFIPSRVHVRLDPELEPADLGGQVIRQGGLTAWTPHDHVTSTALREGAWFVNDDTLQAPDSISATSGVVRALEYVSVLNLPSSTRAPAIGLGSVANTDERPSHLTFHASERKWLSDEHEGQWTHFGWIATFEIAD